MIKLISTIILATLIMGNGEKYATTRKAVDTVNEFLPANTWDGQYLKSVNLLELDNIVEFNIRNVGGRAPKSEQDQVSRNEKVKYGAWVIANFMTAYDYSTKGSGGEGDEEMFKKLGPLLKLMAKNDIGARLNLEFRKGGTITIELSPSELEKAVMLRKKDFY